MITEPIKRFIVMLNHLDKKTRDDVLENISAFSDRLNQYKFTISPQNRDDFNAVFATKLFECMYKHVYYFPQKRKNIQKFHIKDRRRMLIIASVVNNLTKITKEERMNFISNLINSSK